MGTELKELYDALCASAKPVVKEVNKIVAKGDITPSELDSLHKAAELAEKMSCLENAMTGSEMSYGHHMNYRGSYGMDYGMPNEPMGYSEARGRSPVTGRYISRGVDTGYSGHSIEDRMVATLEQQMDNANSEYERSMIQKEINRIRMGNL